MIKEQFFPTIIYGKDLNLNTNELAQNIINWSDEYATTDLIILITHV